MTRKDLSKNEDQKVKTLRKSLENQKSQFLKFTFVLAKYPFCSNIPFKMLKMELKSDVVTIYLYYYVPNRLGWGQNICYEIQNNITIQFSMCINLGSMAMKTFDVQTNC